MERGVDVATEKDAGLHPPLNFGGLPGCPWRAGRGSLFGTNYNSTVPAESAEAYSRMVSHPDLSDLSELSSHIELAGLRNRGLSGKHVRQVLRIVKKHQRHAFF